jgi:formylglycine-generating enzyme required for sulfatase activity
MKNKLHFLVIVLGLFTGVHEADVQGAQFFRITGPTKTTITSFRPDGTLVWSNALAGTNYTIQTVTSLPGGTNWVDYVQLPVTNSVNTNQIIDYHPPSGLALIPAGSFTMGDSLDSDFWALPLHTVYVSAFYMDKYDVTYSLWQSVYNWAIKHGYSFDHAGYGKAANHPVVAINWYDCVKWCNARSEMEGRTPAYYTNATLTLAAVYRTGTNDLQNGWVKWNTGYRLPTEAEWEKAARGGLSGQRFPWGVTISWSQANYYGDPLSLDPGNGYAYDFATAIGYDPTFATSGAPYTSPVGYFAPNGYGLYDMAGNVWQWCWDWSGWYSGGSQTDPRGPTTAVSFGSNGPGRVPRGGSYDSDQFGPFCRVAARNDYGPGSSFYDLGFRSVLPP